MQLFVLASISTSSLVNKEMFWHNFCKFNTAIIFCLPYIATGFPYDLLHVSQWSHSLFCFILQISFPLVSRKVVDQRIKVRFQRET